MTKRVERAEAERLRAKGWSLRRIAGHLNVSISSVSIWVRDVELPQPEPEPQSLVVQQPEPECLELRFCSRCEQILPVTAFNRYGDGYQWWCRECFREYFRLRGDLHRQQSGAARRRRRQRAKAFVDEYLAGSGCTDCRLQDRAVMEFDHVKPKKREVSLLVNDGSSIERIKQEIALCEVVCANCHRRRTARRATSWRLFPDQLPLNARLGPRELDNLMYVRGVLLESQCVDCSEDDLLVLEFDHIGEKNNSVLVMAARGWSLDRIKNEIAQCEIRCSNCHRRRTLSVLRDLAAG